MGDEFWGLAAVAEFPVGYKSQRFKINLQLTDTYLLD